MSKLASSDKSFYYCFSYVIIAHLTISLVLITFWEWNFELVHQTISYWEVCVDLTLDQSLPGHSIHNGVGHTLGCTNV